VYSEGDAGRSAPHNAIDIAKQNIEDRTIVKVPSVLPTCQVFTELATRSMWDDYFEHHFQCLHSDELFCLHTGLTVRMSYELRAAYSHRQ
jgi:hypothetical protein